MKKLLISCAFVSLLLVGVLGQSGLVSVEQCDYGEVYMQIMQGCAFPVMTYVYGEIFGDCESYNCTLAEWGDPDFDSNFCGEAGAYIYSCMLNAYLSVCTPNSYETDVINTIIDYVSNFCDVDGASSIGDLMDADWNDDVNDLLDSIDDTFLEIALELRECADISALEALGTSLLEGAECRDDHPDNSALTSIDELLPQYSGMIASEVDCWLAEVDELLSDCGGDHRDLFAPFIAAYYAFMVYPGINVPFVPLLETLLNGVESTLDSTDRVSVGLFGDPHLLLSTRSSDSAVVTCADSGSATLLSNDYVILQGTSTEACAALGAGEECTNDFGATYLTEITITFLDGDESPLAVYTANSDDMLPDEFSSDDDDNGDTLIISVTDDGWVQITSSQSYIVVLMAENSGTYSLIMRMSQGLMAVSTGSLRTGCENPISRPAAGFDDVAECEGDQQCIYDAGVTGDTNLAVETSTQIGNMLSAAEAMDSDILNTNNNNNNNRDRDNGSASRGGDVIAMVCAVSVVFTLWRQL